MTEEQALPRGSILQRDMATYAVVPRTPLGVVTPEILENIAKVARRYDIPLIKITSGQRIALVGMKPENVDDVWRDVQLEVGQATAPCVNYVQACPGTDVCRFGLQDSLGLGAAIDREFLGIDYPAKVKIGVSGCQINCAESYMRDLGVFGRKKGWTVVFGGNSGAHPRIGDIIAQDISQDEVMALAKKCLEYYAASARKKERTARFVERIGAEEFKKNVLES